MVHRHDSSFVVGHIAGVQTPRAVLQRDCFFPHKEWPLKDSPLGQPFNANRWRTTANRQRLGVNCRQLTSNRRQLTSNCWRSMAKFCSWINDCG